MLTVVFCSDIDFILNFELFIQKVVWILLVEGHKAIDEKMLVFPFHTLDSSVPDRIVTELIYGLAFDWVVEKVLRVYACYFIFFIAYTCRSLEM